MRIVYICNRKARCNDSVYCGKECTHTLNERNARYLEHGKYLIFGDKGNGFVLEELKNDGKDPARVEIYGNEGDKQ